MNEDDVIEGVANYLKQKHHNRADFDIPKRSSAKNSDRGIDLKCVAYSKNTKTGKRVISNRYYIEAKGTLKAKDDSEKKSKFETEFRWAISQIILRMEEFSVATVYGIAVPKTERAACLRLMKNNKGLKLLRVRLYLAYKNQNDEYFAEELKPKDIYE